MTDKSIRFNDSMIRAICAGHKTVTRRPFKKPLERKCGFGQPGDQLWVQETFTLESSYGLGITDYHPPFQDGRPVNHVDGGVDFGTWWEQPHYRATDPTPDLVVEGIDGPGCRWSSSAQMPRWASRILLQITGVDAQRLHEITEGGARIEGSPTRAAFALAWDEIYQQKAAELAWEEDPWIWVIRFEVLDNKTAKVGVK